MIWHSSVLHLHKILLPLGRLGLAAGVKLLVEEIDDSHVVLDVEVVEERLPDLKRRDQLYECPYANVPPSLFKNQISISIILKFSLFVTFVGFTHPFDAYSWYLFPELRR